MNRRPIDPDDLRLLPLNMRTLAELQANGVRTVSGLTQMSVRDVRRLVNIGPKATRHIREVLGERGLALRSAHKGPAT